MSCLLKCYPVITVQKLDANAVLVSTTTKCVHGALSHYNLPWLLFHWTLNLTIRKYSLSGVEQMINKQFNKRPKGLNGHLNIMMFVHVSAI